ncbi:hypothetical protein PAPYR_13255 [Paratrimastix pyriformis]|uniref:Uncharacterized protein n=1 Tax=Paratrimastix pyriformis TaxID=342808 RepID=A0ABQ8U0H7_9EUKA|nr:hypothetical protein PAPYR_13255 [Paratrimastix pyriformis]
MSADIPPAGQWIRLTMPAARVGLTGVNINRFSVEMVEGRIAWVDYEWESRLWLGATDLLDPMAASPPLVGDHCDQPPLCMATFTPSRVGHYPLRVMVGHDAIPELVNVTVLPAPVAPGPTTWQLSAGGVVAGEPLRVVVTAWDEFANSIPCTPEAAKATFGLLWNGAPPRDPLIWSCIVEEHDPVYAGLLAPTTSGPVEVGLVVLRVPGRPDLGGPWPVPIARSPSPRVCPPS